MLTEKSKPDIAHETAQNAAFALACGDGICPNAEAACNQTRSDLRLLDDDAGKHETPSTHIESRLGLAERLHGLESSERLIALEAKTSRNISWCKGVLSRWKEADYPDPKSWPEIQQSQCFHPSYSLNHGDWPDMALKIISSETHAKIHK
jgi:hypothetical protein